MKVQVNMISVRPLLILVMCVVLPGCIKEVSDLREDMKSQPTRYPNDSSTRVLNEMKRVPATPAAAASVPDPRDARIADLEREVAELKAQRVVKTVEPQVRVEKQILVELRAEELFPSGSADLTPEGVKALHRAAERLKAVSSAIKHVTIDGHTDDRPIHTARFPSNQELSEARAGIVARFLKRETGLPNDRFVVTGYADTRPIASNSDAAGRARNRRVEVTVTSQDTVP